MAAPLCRLPSLTLSVHSAREGPAPRAQVSSLLALPCPVPGVLAPLGGACAPPCSTSLGDVIVAVLVKPVVAVLVKPFQNLRKKVSQLRSCTLCIA